MKTHNLIATQVLLIPTPAQARGTAEVESGDGDVDGADFLTWQRG